MKNEDKLPTWETILLSYQARLRVDLNWYPYPAFISFLLVWVLSGHILPGLNPRRMCPLSALSLASRDPYGSDSMQKRDASTPLPLIERSSPGLKTQAIRQI